jgi:hypothetical protein
MFGERDRSLKTSEAAGRSSSGVSGGGVALSPSVLEDDVGDFFAGDVYLRQTESGPDHKAFASIYALTISLGVRRATRATPTGLRRHRSRCFIQ